MGSIRFRTILAAAAAPLALGSVLLTATAASAAPKAPGTVYATTHESGVDDTFTLLTGPATRQPTPLYDIHRNATYRKRPWS